MSHKCFHQYGKQRGILSNALIQSKASRPAFELFCGIAMTVLWESHNWCSVLKVLCFLFYFTEKLHCFFLVSSENHISAAVRLAGNCIIEGLNRLLGGGNKAREDTISL